MARKIEVEVSEAAYEKLSKAAERLGTDVSGLLSAASESLSSYTGDLVEWGLELRVRKENRVQAVFDELVYYGVEARRGVVNRVLSMLKAKGRFELEELTLDPVEPSLEIELVALEGSDLLCDRVRINWSLNGVIVESYYYNIGSEAKTGTISGFNVSYLPDEDALVVSYTARSLTEVPPLHKFDSIVRNITSL